MSRPAVFAPGMGPIIWRAVHKRMHSGFHARAEIRNKSVQWCPPVPRKWATPRHPAALRYYKILDRINLGLAP